MPLASSLLVQAWPPAQAATPELFDPRHRQWKWGLGCIIVYWHLTSVLIASWHGKMTSNSFSWSSLSCDCAGHSRAESFSIRRPMKVMHLGNRQGHSKKG